MSILSILFILSIQNKDSLGMGNNKKVRTDIISKAPVIDGRLNDECWNEADSVYDFMQTSPFSGKKSSVKTTVKIAHNENTLFVSFYCEKIKKQPAATVLKEDVLGMNDQVMVLFDTFKDKNKAYLFAVNPLNVKTDAKVSQNGNLVDTEWDESWQSATYSNDTSWSAEFAIPFDILRFNTDKDNNWGINFIRVDYGDLPEPEWNAWSYTGANPYNVSKCGTLIWYGNKKYSAPLNITPYFAITNDEKKIGGDLERNFLTIMDVGFSIYTDPAYYDVNQDKPIIQPSQSEVIALPEERNLFIENRTLFSAPYSVINTRNIDTIKYGYRISGKARDYDAAYVGAETQNPKKSYSFLGIEKSFWKGSSVSWYDLKADTNRVMSTQMNLSLPNEIRPSLQYSWNFEENTPYLFYCDVTRKTASLTMNAGYRKICSDFIADMGTISDTGESYWAGGNYNLRVNKFLYQVTPFFSYSNNETKGGLDLLLKNKIGGGVEYLLTDDNKIPTYFVGYNENSWAQAFRVSYMPDSEKTCLMGRLSVIGKISPDFTISMLHFNQDSIIADFGITGRINENLAMRIFMEKPTANEIISTRAVAKYKYSKRGYLTVGYGETRDYGENERTDYIMEAKIYYQFAVPMEKLGNLSF